MGEIVVFPARRHARASSRIAKRPRRSLVTPDSLALSVDSTAGHHFVGMASRFHHLITAQFPAPTSAAMASREAQSSMTDRNDVSFESSTMAESLGHIVPNCKAIMVRDFKRPVGHSVLMAEDPETIAESAWREAFRLRLRKIQGGRSHEDMAELLGVPPATWNKCVNRGDMFPTRKLPLLAKLAGVPLESLIKGDRDDEIERLAPRRKKKTG